MKPRFLSTLILALAIAFSISLASEKNPKSTKTSTTKKEMKSCCMDEKMGKECSDKDMKNCEAKMSKSGAKAQTKDAKKTATDVEVKKN